MKLIKYCKEEHNLTKGCLSIQLGTPGYYRELDPEFYNIADQYEGSYYLEEITNSENGLIYKTPKALVPNCYIFCASEAEAVPNAIDVSYNSKYLITDPKKFYNSLAEMLIQQLEIHDFTETCQSLIRNPSGSSEITIQVIGGSDHVNYESLVSLERNVNSTELEDLANLYKKIIFTKHEKFNNDKEVRFAFVIHHSKYGILSVKPEPKLLKISSSLLDCLSQY